MSFRVTLDAFSRLVHFKLIHYRVMSNMNLFKMNLVDSSTCLFCNREEIVAYVFLECENVTRSWRNIECWIRRVIERHFRLSDADKIFGTLPISITVNK